MPSAVVLKFKQQNDLAEELRSYGRPVKGPALFICKHQVFGVGMFSAESVRAGDRVVAEAGASGAPVDVLVGTISSCHGALNLLTVGPLRSAQGELSGRPTVRP